MFSLVAVPTILSGIDFIHAPTDLILISSDFPSLDVNVHRVVMACSSPFLHRLMQFQSEEDAERIELRWTSCATLKSVAQFSYNGTCDLTGIDMEKLFEEADYLNVQGLCDLIKDGRTQYERSKHGIKLFRSFLMVNEIKKTIGLDSGS